MKRIPLHSLVFLVGPTRGGKTYLAEDKFPNYEVIRLSSIQHSLTGELSNPLHEDLVFNEMARSIKLKLSLGERVVIDSYNLRKSDRTYLADIGYKLGVPVFYIVVNRPLSEKIDGERQEDVIRDIKNQEEGFVHNEREILRGDGIANVIDYRRDDFDVVKKFQTSMMLEDIKSRGYRGIMVIGDVHGMIEPLKNATEWATRRELFAVFLGDLLDYGPSPLDCIEHVYDIVMRGRGISLIGNHERKIERWLDQMKRGEVRLRLSEGNRVTTRAIEALSSESRIKFECKFKSLLSHSRHHLIIGETLFAHGAAEPEMFEIYSSRLSGHFETMALFGEVDGNKPNSGYPNRVYNWVDRIPAGKRVMVGHDIRSTLKPLFVQNENGGEAYFMDTGCGKGGQLTSADILFENGALSVKNFKYH